jgi:uncharacterized protein
MSSEVSPLLQAVYRGDKKKVAQLLAGRRDLDIFEASATGDIDRVRALLDKDPALASAYASDGFHPLGLAAFFRQPEVVRLLLERGADVAAPARNPLAVTALHSAVANDSGPVQMEIVTLLLDAGAPVNATHQGGGRPLHTAAFTGDTEVARLLLARGADTSLRTDEGKTPADIARERGHDAVARMLEAGR